MASSIALVGFGLDSTVEVFSAVVILWQFRGVAHEREAQARKLIAVSFFVLAAYVAAQAVVDLVAQDEPATSPVGIALAVASLLVMPALAIAERDAGRRLHSRPCSLTATRRSRAPTCPPSCSAVSSSTPQWVGGGPILSPRSASPASP